MNKGLEALHNPRIVLAKIDISAEGKHDIAYMPFYKTKQYTAIEEELKELEELREMMRRFNEACVPMVLDNETEKKLKALEIIKKCPFDLLEWAKNYDDVNNTNFYALLKEVLL